MGSLNFAKSKQSEVILGRVTGLSGSGEFKVSVNSSVRRVNSAIQDSIRVNDTVLLNKTPHGKYYIVGITKGLGNSKNVMEVVKNG
jgi:hypothetical protein